MAEEHDGAGGDGATGDPKPFDVARVRQLVEMMDVHELSEIDLRWGDERIRLRRGGPPQPVAMPMPAASAPVPVAASAGASPSAEPAPAAPAGVEIPSPVIGTFYLAPNPGAPPFVKVGDRVGPETVVCIVVAMKVNNEIQAETSGTIAEVLVANEQPVEFGQPLFRVVPD